jgi:integrase
LAEREELEAHKAPATATVKKERAAINRLAKYPHTVDAIDATEILMTEGSRAGALPRRRDAFGVVTWKRVKDLARARRHQGPRGRTSTAAANRDLALILVLGEMGLRSEETRVLGISSIAPKRADGLTPWLTVHGKGAKIRELPIPAEVADELPVWLEQREADHASQRGDPASSARSPAGRWQPHCTIVERDAGTDAMWSTRPRDVVIPHSDSGKIPTRSAESRRSLGVIVLGLA